jgi:serine/threonine-protein kinase
MKLAATIAPGVSIGHYKILAPIGSGGMGEVWRARDSKLDRDVAIKTLPGSFAGDAERLARLEREARMLAALNHPNVAAIHGLEEVDGRRFLVLELVEGPTLSERLREGRIPVIETLKLALQIAESLEAAHEKGVIHRDLKPANIKITPEGRIKVLDFGLAKALQDSKAETSDGTALSTETGIIMGTPAYMSPEQTRGESGSRHVDIWAFGVVLYEMLTGMSPFGRKTTAETLACVIGTPPEYSAIPADTPENVQRLIRRCPEKDPRRRAQHMGDIRLELEEALAAGSTGTAVPVARQEGSVPVTPVGRSRKLWLASGVAVMAVAAVLIVWAAFKQSVSRTAVAPVHLSIPFQQGPFLQPFSLRHLAVSRDGNQVAYASSDGLWIRRMDQKDARLLVRNSSSNPFFSPDGKWIAFFSGPLYKMPTDGGTLVQLAHPTARPLGGAWHSDSGIVYATTEGLFQISPEGGTPRLLLRPKRDLKESAYAWPEFLPDGQAITFTILFEGSIDGARVAVLDLATLQPRVVIQGGVSAQYVPTGHLIYALGRGLRAVPFDTARRETRGDAISISDIQVFVGQDNGASEFAISDSGTLILLSDIVRVPATLRWMDRQGNEELLPLPPGSYGYPRVSPDGKRVALDRAGGSGRDIWILHLDRMSLTQLTDGPREDMTPIWNPDGSRIYFASDRTGDFDVYSQEADGAGPARLEFKSDEIQTPNSFTPDGKHLVIYHRFHDLNVLDLPNPTTMTPLLNSSNFDERLGPISPDGQWMAYESDESGKQFEIMLRPFPNAADRREKISVDGGRYPRWSSKGDELFYVTPEGAMMAVPIMLTPKPVIGRPSKLFDYQKPPAGRSGRPYDVSPIDGRFIMPKPLPATGGPTNISVILNFFEDLRRRFAAR